MSQRKRKKTKPALTRKASFVRKQQPLDHLAAYAGTLTRARVAIHEACHAVMASTTNMSKSLQYVTIAPSSDGMPDLPEEIAGEVESMFAGRRLTIAGRTYFGPPEPDPTAAQIKSDLLCTITPMIFSEMQGWDDAFESDANAMDLLRLQRIVGQQTDEFVAKAREHIRALFEEYPWLTPAIWSVAQRLLEQDRVMAEEIKQLVSAACENFPHGNPKPGY